MTGKTWCLHGKLERELAASAILTAPDLWRVTLQEPARSKDQNRALWSALDDISEQLEWHGQKYPSEEWKEYMMHALKRARWMPFEDGGMVPIGMSSSKLSHSDFSDLIEVARSFGARHGVALPREPPRASRMTKASVVHWAGHPVCYTEPPALSVSVP